MKRLKVILAIILFGCSGKGKAIYNLRDEGTIPLRPPIYSMFAQKDSFLYMLDKDWRADTFYLYRVNLNTHKIDTFYILKGEGPGEIGHILRAWGMFGNGDTVFVYYRIKNKVFMYDIPHKKFLGSIEVENAPLWLIGRRNGKFVWMEIKYSIFRSGTDTVPVGFKVRSYYFPYFLKNDTFFVVDYRHYHIVGFSVKEFKKIFDYKGPKKYWAKLKGGYTFQEGISSIGFVDNMLILTYSAWKKPERTKLHFLPIKSRKLYITPKPGTYMFVASYKGKLFYFKKLYDAPLTYGEVIEK